MRAADKMGAKVVEDWICPSFAPTTASPPPRPHDDDPSAGSPRRRTDAQGSAAAAAGSSSSSSFNRADTDAGGAAGARLKGTPMVGAYVGGILAALMLLLGVTALVSYYVAARS